MLSVWMSGLLLAAQGVPAGPPIMLRPQAVARVGRTPPPFPNKAVPAQSLPTLFWRGDYPSVALRARQQGLVAFTLAIGPTGRVENCTVAQSSGSIALDTVTCSILRRRARYFPARDAHGNAVADTARGRIKWALPVVLPVPQGTR
jgi:TonB family protein